MLHDFFGNVTLKDEDLLLKPKPHLYYAAALRKSRIIYQRRGISSGVGGGGGCGIISENWYLSVTRWNIDLFTSELVSNLHIVTLNNSGFYASRIKEESFT